MDKINIATVSGVASSATAVPVVIPEFQKAKALIRRFSALGNDAAWRSSFTCRSWRVRSSCWRRSALPRPGQDSVDVAGGHTFKGHTLTQADKLLALTPTGWKVVGAQYADVGRALLRGHHHGGRRDSGENARLHPCPLA